MQMKIVFILRVPDTIGFEAGQLVEADGPMMAGGLIEFEASKPRVAIKQEYTPMVKLYPV